MKKEFVTYEIALKLKELGFDEECIGGYGNIYSIIQPDYIDAFEEIKEFPILIHKNVKVNDTFGWYTILCKAPLWQQVIDWLREKYNNVINVYANASGYLFEMHDSAKIGGTHRYDSGFDGPNEGGCWDNYYEAREQSILKAIELCQRS